MKITSLAAFNRLKPHQKEYIVKTLNEQICYYYVEYKVNKIIGSMCFFWAYQSTFTRYPTYELILAIKKRIRETLDLSEHQMLDIELNLVQAALSPEQVFQHPEDFPGLSITINE